MADPKAVRIGSPSSARQSKLLARRIAWAIGIATLVLIALVMLLGVGVRNDVACGACHEMTPYIEASAESPHPSLGCSECHATSGVGGVPIDGLRALSWAGASEVTVSRYDDTPCVECHENVLEETVEARGIRVRHSDFAEAPCTDCHAGTGHQVEGRYYSIAEMDDCMSCHRSSVTNIDTCETCHVSGSSAERKEGSTAWRVTHGPGWEQTHGMGDLETCNTCHIPTYCIDCHGVRVPHASDWFETHGENVASGGDDECATCHEPAWCTSCHQVEMPHPEGFLKVHGPEAEETGEETCNRCHDSFSCDNCHLQSSHPQVPGVGMGHEG